MAEEPLKYKITFDTSEIPQKLSEVKAQMDLLMGSQAFQTQGPDPYPFSSMFQNGIGNTFGAVQNGFGSVGDALNQVATTARLGYSKFTNDVELQGLLTRMAERSTRGLHSSYEQVTNQISQQGFFGSAMGQAGFGYNPTMPLTRSEFQDLNESQAEKTFLNPSMGDAVAFGASALFGGPISTGLTGGLLATKLALYPFLAEKRARNKTASFIEKTSFRSLGGSITGGAADDIAGMIQEFPNQDRFSADGYTSAEVDQMVFDFTGSGGMDMVKSADEYKRTIMSLMDNHRTVMKTLHVTSQEATKIMAELNRDFGITNQGEMTSRLQALGNISGLTGSEMVAFSGRAAEMVRGSGVSMKSAFEGAADLLATVRQGAKDGAFSAEDLRQAGGAENLALQSMRSAYNYLGSPYGMVTQSAFLGDVLQGGSGYAGLLNSGPMGRLDNAASMLSSPMAMAEFFGMRTAITSAINPEIAQLDEVNQHRKQLQMLFGRNKFTDTQFKGGLIAMGVDESEATRMTGFFKMGPETFMKKVSDQIDSLGDMVQSKSKSEWDNLLNKYSNALKKTLYDPLVDVAEAAEEKLQNARQSIELVGNDLFGGMLKSKPTGFQIAGELGMFTPQAASQLQGNIEAAIPGLNAQRDAALKSFGFSSDNTEVGNLLRFFNSSNQGARNQAVFNAANRIGNGFIRGMAGVVGDFSDNGVLNAQLLAGFREETSEILMGEQQQTFLQGVSGAFASDENRDLYFLPSNIKNANKVLSGFNMDITSGALLSELGVKDKAAFASKFNMMFGGAMKDFQAMSATGSASSGDIMTAMKSNVDKHLNDLGLTPAQRAELLPMLSGRLFNDIVPPDFEVTGPSIQLSNGKQETASTSFRKLEENVQIVRDIDGSARLRQGSLEDIRNDFYQKIGVGNSFQSLFSGLFSDATVEQRTLRTLASELGINEQAAADKLMTASMGVTSFDDIISDRDRLSQIIGDKKVSTGRVAEILGPLKGNTSFLETLQTTGDKVQTELFATYGEDISSVIKAALRYTGRSELTDTQTAEITKLALLKKSVGPEEFTKAQAQTFENLVAGDLASQIQAGRKVADIVGARAGTLRSFQDSQGNETTVFDESTAFNTLISKVDELIFTIRNPGTNNSQYMFALSNFQSGDIMQTKTQN